MVTPLGYGTITTITQAKWHSVMRKSVSWPSRWLPSPLHTVAVMREECMTRRGYELLLDFWYTGIHYSVDDPRCDNDPLMSATDTPLLNHRTKWVWILRDVSKSLRLLAFCWKIHRNINICSITCKWHNVTCIFWFYLSMWHKKLNCSLPLRVSKPITKVNVGAVRSCRALIC